MTYFVFIQSISFSEYAAGSVLCDWIANHFDTSDIALLPYAVKSFTEMGNAIKLLANRMTNNDRLIICIDAHANESTIYFKDKNSLDKMQTVGDAAWIYFDVILDSLYKKFGNNALVIFISCRSACHFSTLKSPHIPIIAAEGEINAMRANKHLVVLYEQLCKNKTIEQAYDAMIQEFPLEDEIKIEGNHKAVLKLFK